MKTPDITAAQIAAWAAAVLGALVVLFGLDVSATEQAALIGGGSSFIGAAHVIADAIIRHGRATGVAAATVAAAALTPEPIYVVDPSLEPTSQTPPPPMPPTTLAAA